MHSPIVIYGAGAIGCTIYQWLRPYYEDLFLLARGNTASTLRSQGLSLYENSKIKMKNHQNLRVIESLEELPAQLGMIIITVKNYDLEVVCQQLKNVLQLPIPLIVTLQNGIKNLEILPHYFSRVIYGVICYNAWRDSPNIIGYKEKGYIILGTPNNTLKDELQLVQNVFQKGLLCEITSNYLDAAYNKILLNLSNSIFTLLGVGFKEISSISKFRKLTTAITSEGLKILKKAGIKEVKLGSLPSWSLIKAASTLPGFITNPIFKKTIKKSSGINSMAQDLIINRTNKTELDTLNGYLINLGKKVGISPKINQKLFEICSREFSKPKFQPLHIDSLWEEFQEVL